MRYHLRSCSEDINNIIDKLSCMSITNIKWSCLYSGAGILHVFDEKETKKLVDNIGKHSSKELLQNLAMLKCIYKKAKPVFTKPPEEILNPGKYMWDFESFNKLILPSSQAAAILSLCRAAEVVYDTDKALGIVFVQGARVCCDFVSTYMRNEEGLFIEVEDKTKAVNDELKLKPEKGDASLVDQVIIHEAFLYVSYITSDKSRKEYCTSRSSRYLEESRNIFSFIKQSFNLLMDQSSKDISTAISSLSRCCAVESDEMQKSVYKQFIALLCAELESRIKITGEVEKGFGNMLPATLMTHFKTASAFLEGYLVTGMFKFKDLAGRILDYTEDLYDTSMGLFIKGYEKQIRYSTRDIAEILKTLFLYYMVEGNIKTLNMFSEFYNSAIEKTSVMQSLPSHIMKLSGREVNLPDIIPDMKDSEKAPVFVKSFKVDSKKYSVCSASKHFNSLYALYASYTFLFYMLPDKSVHETEAANPSSESEPLPVETLPVKQEQDINSEIELSRSVEEKPSQNNSENNSMPEPRVEQEQTQEKPDKTEE